MKLSARSILPDLFRQFRRVWPQLIFSDLLARGLAVAILTPLVGLLMKLFLATTATGVVADQAIVSFLLHPTGMAALLIVGAVSLGLLFVESGQLMVIGFGALENRRVTWLEALLYAYRRGAMLVRLAGHALVRLLVIALPFLAVVATLAWFMLRRYDINYYLTRKPPEFVAVLAGSGILLTAMALLLIVRIASWMLSVPMVLFENTDGRRALRASERATTGSRRGLSLWIVGWLVAAALLSTAVTALVGLAADLLVPQDLSRLTLLLIVLSGFLLVGGLANLLVSVVTTVLFPLLVVHLYRRLAGPGQLRPEIAGRGTLGERASWRIPGKAVLAACAGVLLAVLAASYFTLGDRRLQDNAQIIAHRGGAAVAPENTMAAFSRGIAEDADWLELDVQESADGVVMVGHDRDFMRVAGNDLEVWKATNAELAALDVGSFFDPEYSDQRPPSLREVLQLARDKAGLFIELKYYGHDVRLEQRVVDLVEETGMSSEVVIMSLEYDGLRRMAALRPDWSYGLLNAVAIGDLTRLEVDFLALTAKATSYSMIRRTHEKGMKIFAWTIDDPVQMWVMMSRGVDGIITDRVKLAHQVKKIRAGVSPLGRFIIWMAGEAGLLSGTDRSSERDEA